MKAQFVYFIKPVGMPGPIKIGVSNEPVKRLENLAAWSPWPLEILATIPGDKALEQNIHECFAPHHSHKEWFNPHPDIWRLIERLRAGESIEAAIDLNDRKGNIRSAAARNKVTARTKLIMRYHMRLHGAEKKVGGQRWAPADVREIMMRWGGDKNYHPTLSEFARLDEVIASPSAHFQTREDRFPTPEAA